MPASVFGSLQMAWACPPAAACPHARFQRRLSSSSRSGRVCAQLPPAVTPADSQRSTPRAAPPEPVRRQTVWRTRTHPARWMCTRSPRRDRDRDCWNLKHDLDLDFKMSGLDFSSSSKAAQQLLELEHAPAVEQKQNIAAEAAHVVHVRTEAAHVVVVYVHWHRARGHVVYVHWHLAMGPARELGQGLVLPRVEKRVEQAAAVALPLTPLATAAVALPLSPLASRLGSREHRASTLIRGRWPRAASPQPRVVPFLCFFSFRFVETRIKGGCL